MGISKKIQIVRVHEVGETVRALKAFAAVGGIDGQVTIPTENQ